MYLHLGENTVVRTENIIGIFDMDTSTISKWTKDYLSNATKNKRVINVSMELPKSFVVCNENNEIKVYVSQISSQAGNEFEREFCEMLSKDGFWAHFMGGSKNGQPADIIAVRK